MNPFYSENCSFCTLKFLNVIFFDREEKKMNKKDKERSLSCIVMRSREISLMRGLMWHFQFHFLIEVLIWRGTFSWKLHLNRTSGSKVMSNWMILWTIENNNEKHFFFWLYLTINAPDIDFRLIIDRNTCTVHFLYFNRHHYKSYPIRQSDHASSQHS